MLSAKSYKKVSLMLPVRVRDGHTEQRGHRCIHGVAPCFQRLRPCLHAADAAVGGHCRCNDKAATTLNFYQILFVIFVIAIFCNNL